jgi:hypothetical protein
MTQTQGGQSATFTLVLVFCFENTLGIFIKLFFVTRLCFAFLVRFRSYLIPNFPRKTVLRVTPPSTGTVRVLKSR